MNCQNLFSGKNKKNVSKCLPLKNLPSLRALTKKNDIIWYRHYMPLFCTSAKSCGKEILEGMVRKKGSKYSQNVFPFEKGPTVNGKNLLPLVYDNIF